MTRRNCAFYLLYTAKLDESTLSFSSIDVEQSMTSKTCLLRSEKRRKRKKRPIHWMNWNKNANLINDLNCLSSSFQVMYLAVSLSSASARRSLIVYSFAKRQIKMFWNVCETIAICFQLHEIHFFQSSFILILLLLIPFDRAFVCKFSLINKKKHSTTKYFVYTVVFLLHLRRSSFNEIERARL